MLNSVLANIIAGLGLFFSGLRLIDANLRQATGRRLRLAVGRVTDNGWLSGGVGLLIGALFQSTSAIVFILVSLVASGLTTVRRTLPLVTWANVGCSALIFVAVLDLRVGILYVLGVAGAAFAFDRSHRSHALGAVFGIGMLFYGIDLMKAGAEPLKQLSWFQGLPVGSHNSLIVAFVGATALSLMTQSSTAVSILAIGLAQTGLLGPLPTMSAVYGANLGSTFSRILLSSGLRGSVRQIPAFQNAFKIAGTIVFMALLYLEAFAHVPLVYHVVGLLTSRVERQMAFVFLLFNLGTAVVFTWFQSPILALIERRLPADVEEDLSAPQFLYEEALSEPATALDLVELEQRRLAQRLRVHTQAMRGGPQSPDRPRAAALHKPFGVLAGHIEHFQHDLVDQPLGSQEAERLTKLQNRLSLIVYLEDSLRSLTQTTEAVPVHGRLGDLVSTFVEGLDFVLMTLISAMETGGAEQVDLLITVTEDRGELMESIRHAYVEEGGAIGAQERALMLQVTNIFERIIWITQRLARLIARGYQRESPQAAALVAPDVARLPL
jgi:phosphate:Na+ symporter